MTEAASLLAGPDPDAATRRAFHWADSEADDAPDAVLCLTQSTDRADELERRWAENRNPLRFTATTLDRFVSDCYERATGSLADTTLSKPERLRLVEAAIGRFDGSDGPFGAIEQPSNDLVDQVQGLFSLLEYAGYATPDEMEQALRSAGAVGNTALNPDLFASFRSTEVSDDDGSLEAQAALSPSCTPNINRSARSFIPTGRPSIPSSIWRYSTVTNYSTVTPRPSTPSALMG